MTCTGMQYDEHLVFLARLNTFTKTCEENTVVSLVLVGILDGKLRVSEIFIDMYGRSKNV